MKDLYFQTIDAIEKRQWELLKKQLSYTAENSSYYKNLFHKYQISIARINSKEDFRRIPITSKEELQLHNSDFISIAEEDIIDFVTTSGTLGSPVNFALNENDLQRLAENEYQSFKIAGLNKSDKVQITTTLDRRFMAGMAYFLGLRKLGAGIIRTGSGLTGLQWDSIQRFKPNYLVAVPSFLLKMIEFAEQHQIDFKNSSIKAAICIGEPLRNQNLELNALGKKIKDLWDIELFSSYASTEMATAFTECHQHKGNHVLSDLIFTEILNDRNEPVKPGEVGELVVTPIGTETMPLLRFATGDMVSYSDAYCGCGRNTLRLSAVLGRRQQKMKIKGTSLYPQHLIEVLNSFGEIEAFIIEAKKDEVGNDMVVVKVAKFDDRQIIDLKDYFKSQLQVTPQIEVVDSEILKKLRSPKESRKPQLFLDLR